MKIAAEDSPHILIESGGVGHSREGSMDLFSAPQQIIGDSTIVGFADIMSAGFDSILLTAIYSPRSSIKGSWWWIFRLLHAGLYL